MAHQNEHSTNEPWVRNVCAETHTLASLGGETIQLWRSHWGNHITWVLPVWVEKPFSCDGQIGGTTSPGCCQPLMERPFSCDGQCGGTTSPGHYPSGWRDQLWWWERRNHITWVLPVWVETAFSSDYPSGGTTSPGCCQSGWRRHSAVTVRTEKPPSPGSCQSYTGIWGNGTNHTLKFEELEPVILEYMGKRGKGTSHLWHGKSDSLFFHRCCWPHVLYVLDLKVVNGTWAHLLELLLWAVWDIDTFLLNPPFPGILVTQGKWEIMSLIRNCRGSSCMSLGAWGIVSDIKGIVGFRHARGTLDGIEVHNGNAVRSRDVWRLYGAHCGFVVCGCWI